MSPAEEDDWQRVLSDPDVADPALGPAHAIAVDMECLAMLNRSALLSPDPAPLLLLIIFLLARLPDTVEALSGELQKQLFNIMTKTTQQLVESGRYPQVWLMPLLLLLSLLQYTIYTHMWATSPTLTTPTSPRATKGCSPSYSRP